MLRGASVLSLCLFLIYICYCDDYNKPGTCYRLVIKHPKCFEILELRLPVMELERALLFGLLLPRPLLPCPLLLRPLLPYALLSYALFHPNLPSTSLTSLTLPAHSPAASTHYR